jgi:hypothetical protein
VLDTTSPGVLLQRAELLPLRGPWPGQHPGVYAIYYGRDQRQPVYVGCECRDKSGTEPWGMSG